MKVIFLALILNGAQCAVRSNFDKYFQCTQEATNNWMRHLSSENETSGMFDYLKETEKCSKKYLNYNYGRENDKSINSGFLPTPVSNYIAPYKYSTDYNNYNAKRSRGWSPWLIVSVVLIFVTVVCIIACGIIKRNFYEHSIPATYSSPITATSMYAPAATYGGGQQQTWNSPSARPGTIYAGPPVYTPLAQMQQ